MLSYQSKDVVESGYQLTVTDCVGIRNGIRHKHNSEDERRKCRLMKRERFTAYLSSTSRKI